MARIKITCECGFVMNIYTQRGKPVDAVYWERVKSVLASEEPNCQDCGRAWAKAVELQKFEIMEQDVSRRVQ